ncbi:DNA polymerase zeta [Podila humilis]|nr:DNA polymerase zeta [Podila humilis]
MNTSTLHSSGVGTLSALDGNATMDSVLGGQSGEHQQHTPSAPLESDTTDPSLRPVKFKTRIADLDYSMQAPGPLDLISCQFLPPHVPVLKVPVVRIFGANGAGQKCCVHIHQAYPYFYIPYEGSLESAKLHSYIQQLGVSLNHAAAITFNAPQDLRRSQYVAAITPVKGIPFYGYYVGYSYFLKIYLFNPDFESRIVELMRSGAIMATHFQPFEAHVPFKLQFFIDYNLYGMGWLELEDALLRNNVPEPRAGDSPLRMTKASVQDTQIWSRDIDPGRISTCEIEMDTTVDRIVNRDRVMERDIHKDLGECFKPRSTTAQVPSMAGLWEDDARRRKANGLPTQESPKTQARDDESIPWINHDRSMQMVADLVREMMDQSQAHVSHQIGSTFNSFKIDEDPLAASFLTTYSSVDFLCPRAKENKNGRSMTQTQNDSFVYNEADSSIVVDESKISQAAPVDLPVGLGLEAQDSLFKDLRGLGGLEDQVDDDDDIRLPEENDMYVEDLMDDADIWDHFEISDTDAEEPDYDSANPADNEFEPGVPQFDGGGDSRKGTPFTKRPADQEWKKAVIGAKVKRARSSSSTSLASSREQNGNKYGKRFCEILEVVRPNLTPRLNVVNPVPAFTGKPASHSDPNEPALVSEKVIRHMTPISDLTVTPRFQKSPKSPKSGHSDKKDSKFKGKTVLDCVQVPTRELTVSPAASFERPVDPSMRLVVTDDPIVDVDDEEEVAEKNYDSTTAEPRPIFSWQKVEFDYPEPASPDRPYFLAAMDELWSSPSPPPERPAFIHNPPRPSTPTPTRKHARRVSFAATAHQVLKNGDSSCSGCEDINDGDNKIQAEAQDSVMDAGAFERDPGDMSHMVNQTFLVDADSEMDIHSQTFSPRHRKDTARVLAEDSFTLSQSIQTPGSQQSPECASIYEISVPPSSVLDLQESFGRYDLPNVVHQKPYFSNEADVPSRVKVFGGKEFKLYSHGVHTMKPFKSQLHLGHQHHRAMDPGIGFKFWEPIQTPISRLKTEEWLREEDRRVRQSLRSAAEASTQKRREKISQIEGPTQKNPFGYKTSPTKIAGSVAIEKDFMEVLSLEVHCQTRGALLPDPKHDPILAVFYCWQTEREEVVSNGWVPGYRVGVITHAEAGMIPKLATGLQGVDMIVAENESDMMNAVIQRVREMDPDILAGYEVNNLSWGYLVDRYLTLFSLDMSKLLSRIRPIKPPIISKSAKEARDSFNSTHNVGLKFQGRHLFNVWRLIRNEVALTNYSFSNIVFHVLQQSLQLVERQELVSRTSEFARVFGVDFFSVISRGSQYKVESMMIRLAKPENFVMITPSRAQVGAQRALEIIPMIMEPESAFYEDPVVVLDFQSLYPSVMIAYNYCYSTCLGKLGGGTKLGVTEYRIPDGILPLMQDHVQVAPNHVMYVNQDIRKSLLSRMLSEILDTRVMVKKAMKEYPDNKSLLKLLEARQLGLKFIANVTYGYTSASFSGRMPGIEIADSIVLSGRETLERAIRFVNENPKWNARVVYGDTDSMFVQLKGRTREEAFEIGYDISETITRMNPRPVKLKFEKVYHPCFLVTKKSEKAVPPPGAIVSIRRMELDPRAQPQYGERVPYVVVYGDPGARLTDQVVEPKELLRNKDLRLNGEYYIRKMIIPSLERIFQLAGVDVKSWFEEMPRVKRAAPMMLMTNATTGSGTSIGGETTAINTTSTATEPSEVIPTAATSALVAAESDAMMISMTTNNNSNNSSNNNSNNVTIPGSDHVAAMGAGGTGEQNTESSAAGSSSRPFKPRRRGGKGVVSIGSRIDRYYQSQMCVICNRLISGQTLAKDLCADCSSESGRAKSVLIMHTRLNKAQKLARATEEVCSSCCRAPPHGGAGVQRTLKTFTIPTSVDGLYGQPSTATTVALKTPLSDGGKGLELVACESLECGVFWQRRNAQDALRVTHALTNRVVRDLEDIC